MLNRRIKELRNAMGLSQAALGKELNLTQQAIAKWEKGVAEPDSDNIGRLALYFDVSADYLLGYSEIPKPKIELPPELSWSFINGYREIDDDDRAMLQNMMERMKEAKKARDLLKSKGG